MKQIFIFCAAIFVSAIISCNDTDKSGDGKLTSKQKADQLEKEVFDGHDAAMPKSQKIPKLQQETQRLIDSIGKLPAKAQEAAAPYKAKLESLYKELGEAYDSMEKWMEEFNYDSAKNNFEQRVKYLADEKLRVEKVKDAVLSSIDKANAVLKEKF